MTPSALREINTTVNTAVTLIAIYLALKAMNTMKPLTDSVETAARNAGQWWFNLTRGATSSVRPLGSVLLPGGASTTIAAIVDAGGKVDGQGFFNWRGEKYQITGRNSAGDYVAVRIVN